MKPPSPMPAAMAIGAATIERPIPPVATRAARPCPEEYDWRSWSLWFPETVCLPRGSRASSSRNAASETWRIDSATLALRSTSSTMVTTNSTRRPSVHSLILLAIALMSATNSPGRESCSDFLMSLRRWSYLDRTSSTPRVQLLAPVDADPLKAAVKLLDPSRSVLT